MLLTPGEFQIPKTEYTQSQPEIVEASPVVDAPQTVDFNYDSLVRGSDFYENREALLGKQAEERNTCLEIIAKGNFIHAQRRAEVEKRLNAPKRHVMNRVFNMIMTGQIAPSVDPVRRSDEIFRDLMNTEGRIGSSLLPVPDNVDQNFFLSDSHPTEWFYHARSLSNPEQSRTLRYLVTEQDGIFVSTDGGQYKKLEGGDLDYFIDRVQKYAEVVSRDLYTLAA